jgi:hypothetical protein
MRFEKPRHIPVEVSLLPATWRRHGAALAELVGRYPAIFGDKPAIPPDFARAGQDDPYYRKGTFTDEWGCVWENIADGLSGMVTVHPAPTRQDVHALRPPPAATPGFPHGFMFLRLADLRGFEEIMVDFIERPPELQMLIDLVLMHNLRKLEATLPLLPPGHLIVFGDDLGTQKALPISPALWRKYLTPCYRAIYGRCRQAGHDVYMHTDGCIHEIIPDLIECGVNVLNPQVRANGLDNLVRTCKGKVCVNLDLDRQLFPFADAGQIRDHVYECVGALFLPQGGLWLQAECEPDVPLETIDAICQALTEARNYR